MNQPSLPTGTSNVSDTQTPKFEFVLTTSTLAESLTNHGLTPQQMTAGRFRIQTNKLNLELLQNAFPRDIPDASKNALEELIQFIKEWPNKLDRLTLTTQVSSLLKHWLECYCSGTSIKVGLNLTNFIEFQLGFFSKKNYQFQLLLHDLIAECTSQFESYKFQYSQTHDTISGLANLQVLEKHLPQLFRNDGTLVGLLVIRMTIAASKNNARAIANTEVIKEISHIIRSYLAPGQLLFQIRRDEFAVLIANIESQIALDLLATKLTRVIDVALHGLPTL